MKHDAHNHKMHARKQRAGVGEGAPARIRRMTRAAGRGGRRSGDDSERERVRERMGKEYLDPRLKS